LFVAGTSSVAPLAPQQIAIPLSAGQREKVGDEPGLNSDGHRNVLNNLAGKTVRK